MMAEPHGRLTLVGELLMRFDFATAGRILFGRGAAAQAAGISREFGARALVVTGRNRERAASVLRGLDCAWFPVAGEPSVDTARDGVRLSRSEGCSVVIGIGGGSAIDAGKAIAALATNSGEPLDYLEVVGRGAPLARAPLPFIALPTTAGTGSEVTRNAVLGSPEHKVKASLRSPLMLPRAALVDPDLTLDLPPEITASTGLDALTQLIEPYVCARRNAFADMFCLEGMRAVARCLQTAYHDGGDREAREAMSFASLLGGLALANAGLGVVHGFAAPIGGMFSAPHGAVCAALLAQGMEANIEALRSRSQEAELERYRQIAVILTGNSHAAAEDGVQWVRSVCAELRISSLRAYGVSEAHVAELAAKAANASSMKANPVALESEELQQMLRSAL
jgi:alcohol dehydrogenase class IV